MHQLPNFDSKTMIIIIREYIRDPIDVYPVDSSCDPATDPEAVVAGETIMCYLADIPHWRIM